MMVRKNGQPGFETIFRNSGVTGGRTFGLQLCQVLICSSTIGQKGEHLNQIQGCRFDRYPTTFQTLHTPSHQRLFTQKFRLRYYCTKDNYRWISSLQVQDCLTLATSVLSSL